MSLSFDTGLEFAAEGIHVHNSKEDFQLKHSSRRHLKRKSNRTVILFAGVISLVETFIPSYS